MQSNDLSIKNITSVSAAEVKNPSPATSDAVRVARWSRNPTTPSMLAVIEGPLTIANNCLVMKYENAPPTLLIFSYRSGVWDGAKQTFTYYGKVIRIGEPIKVGGGRTKNLNYLKANGKYNIPNCGMTDWFVVN